MPIYSEETRGPEPRLRGVGQWMNNNNGAMGDLSALKRKSDEPLATRQPEPDRVKKQRGVL